MLDARRMVCGGFGEDGFNGEVAGCEGRRVFGVVRLGVFGAEEIGVLNALLVLRFETSFAPV